MVKELVNVDHVVTADGKFLSQYKNSPIFKSFVFAFIEELNEIETELLLFKTDLVLANAEGVNLTRWGVILQSPTRPVEDETFRLLLYALIAAYYSEGRPEDLRALATTAITADSIIFNDIGGGIFSITLVNPVFTFDHQLVVDIINLAKPVGTEFKGFIKRVDPYFGFQGDPTAFPFDVTGGSTPAGRYSILLD